MHIIVAYPSDNIVELICRLYCRAVRSHENLIATFLVDYVVVWGWALGKPNCH